MSEYANQRGDQLAGLLAAPAGTYGATPKKTNSGAYFFRLTINFCKTARIWNLHSRLSTQTVNQTPLKSLNCLTVWREAVHYGAAEDVQSSWRCVLVLLIEFVQKLSA